MHVVSEMAGNRLENTSGAVEPWRAVVEILFRDLYTISTLSSWKRFSFVLETGWGAPRT
jgi:hypothetical protein